MFLPAFVLLFILKLRFPANKSIKEIITTRYGRGILKLFRQCEAVDLKLGKCACDIDFLSCCLTNSLTPKFVHFKLYAQRLRGDNDYSTFQRKLLEKELSTKRSHKHELASRKSALFGELRSATSSLDYNHLMNYMSNRNSKLSEKYYATHTRKLFNLGLDHRYESLKPDDVIFNHSSHKLSEPEKEALSHGLKYSFNPTKINYTRHFLAFEKIFKTLSENSIYKRSVDSLNYVRSTVKHLAFSSYYGFVSSVSQYEKSLIRILKDLSSNPNLVITKPDKGNGVVLLDKQSYIDKMHTILNDRSKFCLISEEWIKLLFRQEDRVNRFIDGLSKGGIISDEERSRLRVSGSKPGIMYGLPKIHKRNVPLRPILSTIGTSNYDISKFLVNLLSPICNSEYSIKDSFSFAREISQFRNDNYVMASFDVSSLFTSIPISETIEIILSKLYSSDQSVYSNLNRKDFRKLLELCTKDNIFIFNGDMYKQIDGAPMGGCVSPSLAEIFMSHHERHWLDDCPTEFKPVLYRRYVDDTFLLFKSAQHVPLFLQYVNSKHESINFTCEVELDGKLPFLDIEISKSAESFSTGVYRKTTFTGLGLKYDSAISDNYKHKLISCLVDRAYKLCSSFHNFHLDLEFLRSFFNKNGFPQYVIDKVFKLKLNSIFSPRPVLVTVERKVVYFSIPYINTFVNSRLKKDIISLCNRLYPQLNVKLVFSNSFTIGSLFKIKDRLPTLLHSNAIYWFKCGQCNATYCGETTRHLHTRVAEHRGVSPRTHRPVTTPCHSNIRDHSYSSDHPISSTDFKILATVNRYDVRLAESILIHKLKPTLNSLDSSLPLNILN